MESEVLAHSEYAEADTLLGRSVPDLSPRSQLHSVAGLKSWLCFVDFDLLKEDHWLRRGLGRANCQGHAGAVGNRLAQGLRISGYGENMKKH